MIKLRLSLTLFFLQCAVLVLTALVRLHIPCSGYAAWLLKRHLVFGRQQGFVSGEWRRDDLLD